MSVMLIRDLKEIDDFNKTVVWSQHFGEYYLYFDSSSCVY